MSESSPNSRLEAFCDGVFAIAITLLVIDIKVPSAANVNAKKEVWMAFANDLPSFMAFLLSFIFIFVSWVNHSNFFRILEKSSPKFIYANGLLMLSIVLVPFTDAAVAEYLSSENINLAQPAITLYCAVVLLNNIAWLIISYIGFYGQSLLETKVDAAKIKHQAAYIRYGFVLYVFIFVLSFWFPLTSFTIMSLLFVIWLVQSITARVEKMTM